MATPLAPEDPGHGQPKPDESNHSHLADAVPTALQRVVSTSRAVQGEALVSGNVVRALFERVTQQIFQAGLILQVASGDGRSAQDIQSAIDQLDGALVDMRSTVFASAAHLARCPAEEPTHAVHGAIAHLSIAADFLGQVVAGDTARSDGHRWFAANDAEHAVHVALLELLES